jgi:hypothetical protein
VTLGLAFGKIQSAVLEKLPVVTEASQVAGFGKDRQGCDRAHARKRPQALEIGMIAQYRWWRMRSTARQDN